MFFTPELLAKRDSGFGLLWLAATLGSKSTFKKLPKRSVATANISQLCDLIAQPEEPLALRLSSNLMVGVARVYKVKQEIFMSDVTICFNSLKKVVQDIRSMSATDAQLQMAQPSVRASALTLVSDPRTAFVMDFDDLVADWDEYLNVDGQQVDEEDDDFNPRSQSAKNKKNLKSIALTENLRANLHTLDENHEHLLSASFDASLQEHNGGLDLSSSQFDGGFGFDDNFFGASDGLDLEGIGEDLARELGEGWGGPPEVNTEGDVDMDVPFDLGMDMGMDFDVGGEFVLADNHHGRATPSPMPSIVEGTTQKPEEIIRQKPDKENRFPSSYSASPLKSRRTNSPTPFSQRLLNQDTDLPPPEAQQQIKRPFRKEKRVRLLLDPRTELTDDELKTARTQYLEGQDTLRREIDQKKLEKESGKIVEGMLWGVPMGLQAQVLVDFWLDNYKVQVEARSGLFHVVLQDEEPPRKRRKIKDANIENAHVIPDNADTGGDFGNWNADFEMGMDIEFGAYDADGVLPGSGRVHSSEEPGQGRLGSSRPASIRGSNFGVDFGTQNSLGGSQRSNFFPWDNAGDAGVSSSISGAPFGSAGPGSDRISVDHVEVRMRGSSLSAKSRRASSLLPSRMGSIGGAPASPGDIGQDFPLPGEDFAFEVPFNNSINPESQQSDSNYINLERNSFNFLEYAKMQLQTISDPAAFLSFEDVVPKSTSNSHVASAALYHCLVLATKDLLRLEQPEPYGNIAIKIKN